MTAIEVRLEQRDEITLYGNMGTNKRQDHRKRHFAFVVRIPQNDWNQGRYCITFFVLSKNYDANLYASRYAHLVRVQIANTISTVGFFPTAFSV